MPSAATAYLAATQRRRIESGDRDAWANVVRQHAETRAAGGLNADVAGCVTRIVHGFGFDAKAEDEIRDHIVRWIAGVCVADLISDHGDRADHAWRQIGSRIQRNLIRSGTANREGLGISGRRALNRERTGRCIHVLTKVNDDIRNL